MFGLMQFVVTLFSAQMPDAHVLECDFIRSES